MVGGPGDRAASRQILVGVDQVEISEPTLELLACLLHLDLSRLDVVSRIAEHLGPEASTADLARLPSVRSVEDHVYLDDPWYEVDLELDAALAREVAAVAVGWLIEVGEAEEAGRVAVAVGDADLLRSAVRAALAAHPPRAGVDALRNWCDADLLDDHDPHRWWLEAGLGARRGEAPEQVIERYQAVRRSFVELGDVDAEVSVGLTIGILARRVNDLGALAALVERSREIAALGDQRAAAVTLLGDAVVAQLSGDPVRAVEILHQVPVGVLEGDWAAQLSMLRGTNLMLSGRLEEAEVHLEVAIGSGSPWSYATALRLLALVHWLRGRRSLAVEDLEVAARQDRTLGAAATAEDCNALRAAMAALMGHPEAGPMLTRASGGPGLDQEGRVALDVARAAIAVEGGDVSTATEIASGLPLPAQASPTAHWVVGLVGALVDDRRDEIRSVVDAHPSLQRAWDASTEARSALAAGTRVGADHMAYLPRRWCIEGEPEIRINLLGTATVLRNGHLLDHPFWERPRVRELCLYLAMVTNGSRALAAERLWPDLSQTAASRNLRVTLANLLDVLDPDRQRGTGSPLIGESGGSIALSGTDRLTVDLRDEARDAGSLIEASRVGDDGAAIAAARRLVRRAGGPLLGGASLGGWAEEPERDRRDMLLRAVTVGAPRALSIGDADLAQDLARRGLALDPWAERLHQVVVRAHLQRDDLDGARRALREAIAALSDVGVRPEPPTLRLAHDLGVVV